MGRSRSFARWLEGVDGPRASRLLACGGLLHFERYRDDPEQEWRLAWADFCQQSHLCFFCQAARAGRQWRTAVDRVLEVIRANWQRRLMPFLLTLTVRDGAELGERTAHLFAAWRRFLQGWRNAKNRGGPLAGLAGGIARFEAKIGSGSAMWHPHLHAVVLVPSDVIWAASKGGLQVHVRDAWNQAVGYPAVSDLKPMRCQKELRRGMSERAAAELADDCREVFKYMVKTTELEHQERYVAAETLRGKRLCRPFGVLHGVEMPEELGDDCEGLGPAVDSLWFRFCERLRQYEFTEDPRLGFERSWGDDIMPISG